MTKEFNFKFDFIFWFLILLPTFYVVNTDMRVVQSDFFLMACFVMIGLFHVNKMIGGLMCLTAFQMIFLRDSGLQFNQEKVYSLWAGAVLYHFVFMYLNTQNIKKYMWVFIGILALNIVWCFLQMKGVDPLFRNIDFDKQAVMTEYPAFFALPAFLGNYASMVIPFAASLFPPLIILSVLGLWFSKSTFSVIAGVVSLCFYFWFKKRIVFWAILVLSVLAVGFYTTRDAKEGQFGRRVKVWQLVIKEGLSRQFMGHGFGSYGTSGFVAEVTPNDSFKFVHNNEEVLKFSHDEAAKKGQIGLCNFIKSLDPRYIKPKEISREFQKKEMDLMFWNETHNEYIQILYDLGLPGFILILAFIFNIFKRFIRYGTKDKNCLALVSSFISIVIVSFGHFPFQVARLAGPCIVIIAMLDRCLLNRRMEVV